MKAQARGPRRSSPLFQINVLRAVVATLLLTSLFALLYFWLLPETGGDSSVPPARLVEAPLAGDGPVGVHPGDLARDFEVSGLDGGRFRLSDLRGAPVVVNFWASWCTSCLAELPVLEEQRRAHEADGLVILALNVGEGTGDARGFIDDLRLEGLVVGMDPDLTVADAYGIRGLPHSLFIDSSGTIRAEYIGQLDDETLAEYVIAAIDAVPSGPPPERLRIVTTVAREHVLDAYQDEDAALVRFVSRRFRCSDDYCFEEALTPIREAPGVLAAGLRSAQPEPELIVNYDPDVIEAQGVIDLVARTLAAYEDPLYTRDLELRVH